jgi:hypothetical protein
MVNMSSVVSVAKRLSRSAIDVGRSALESRLTDVISVSRENRSLVGCHYLEPWYDSTSRSHLCDEPLPRTDVFGLALPSPN